MVVIVLVRDRVLVVWVVNLCRFIVFKVGKVGSRFCVIRVVVFVSVFCLIMVSRCWL